MKKMIFLAALAMLFTAAAFAQSAPDTKQDQDAIKKVIQAAYVEGLNNEGDFAKIDQGFHPGFNLLGVGGGNEMWKYPIYSWKEGVQKKIDKGEIPRKEGEEVSVKYLSVDVTGNASVVKLEYYIGEKLTYMDYLSLYKFEDGWKIVSKIFYKFPEDQ